MSIRGLPEWSLADRLRKIRRDRHLTQDQISEVLGIKPVTWASWESGRSRPHDVVEVAALIEVRFGVPAAWTLGVLESGGTSTSGSKPTEPPPIQPRRRWTDGLDFSATA